MAKAASRKLKVFQAQIGFYDTIVAAPSRAAALRAWGVRQDLFAEKLAYQTDAPEAVKAALAHPETPLKRPAGADDPFEVEPGRLPEAPRGLKSPAGKAGKAAAPRSKPKPEPPPPPPDRSALDRAERALHELDEGRRKEEAALRRRQAALEAEADKAENAYLDERQKAAAAVVAAREAYRKGGGRD